MGETALYRVIPIVMITFVLTPIFYVYSPSYFHFQSLIMLFQIISIVAMIMSLQSLLLADTINQHYESSIRDALTGIFNRRYFFEAIKKVISDKSEQEIDSVILCDLDHFKAINDQHGHDIGDEVLINVAKTLKQQTGQKGIVARFGGEEFTVLINNCDLKQAKTFAEELRKAIAALSIRTLNGDIRVTASFGAAQVWDLDEIDATIKLADDALFKAKANGRNQVCIG